MKKTRVFLLASLLCLFSCTKGDDSSAISAEDNVAAVSENGLLIDAEKTNLTDVDAAQVSMLFMRREGPSVATRSVFVNKTVENTFPIKDESGEVAAYVVNYEGGGYGIVSATKKYAPILAFSEEGRLTPASLEGNGIAFWVASITADIADAKATLSDDSPEYTDTRLQWRKYERAPEPLAAATTRNGYYWYLQLRQLMMNSSGDCNANRTNFYAAAQNYGVNYNSNTEETRLKEKQRVLDIQYGGRSVPPVFVWGEGLIGGVTIRKVMPLLKTYWHQFYPYNELIEMRDSGPSEDGETRKPAGCVTIAVAQILNYYCYPEILKMPLLTLQTQIDWTRTQEKFASPANEEIPKLVWMVNMGVFTNNNDSGSSSNIEKAQDFLVLNGYSAFIHSGYEVDQIVRDEITAQRPVYVRGKKSEGHAWVCDGYYAEDYQYRILAYEITNTQDRDFSTTPYVVFLDRERTYTVHPFYHMNWGWKGSWFVDESDPASLQGETTGWYRSAFNNTAGYGDIRILQIIKE